MAPFDVCFFLSRQPHVELLLEYSLNWLREANKLSDRQGQWLFSLMAVLEVPLTPDVCSTLRDIARVCATIRANGVSPSTVKIVTISKGEILHLLCSPPSPSRSVKHTRLFVRNLMGSPNATVGKPYAGYLCSAVQ